MLAGAACVAAAALVSAQQPPAIRHLHVQKGVHMLVGAAGNSVVQVGDDGVLVVDSQPADAAPALRAAIQELSPKAIHTLIDTHVLADRAGGDEAMVKLRGTGATQQVRVIAHEAVLDRLVKSAGEANRPVGGLALNQVISLPINSTYTRPAGTST